MPFSSKMGRETWTEGWGSLVIAIVIALIVRWAFVEAYVIPSSSMLPTLLVHDHIFVNKAAYGMRVPFSEKWISHWGQVKRGDVIVFKYPNEKDIYFIKRVVGLPGDKVLYENGKLYLNDKLIETEATPQSPEWTQLTDNDFRHEDDPEAKTMSKSDFMDMTEKLGDRSHDILLKKDQPAGRSEGPYTVPAAQLFVMGDNRDNSHDSRRWGFLPEDLILGRAMFVWLSCEDTSRLKFLCDPTTLRWSRFFHNVQ